MVVDELREICLPGLCGTMKLAIGEYIVMGHDENYDDNHDGDDHDVCDDEIWRQKCVPVVVATCKNY